MVERPVDETADEPRVDRAGTEVLLDIADAAIVDGLCNRRPSIPDPAGLPADLRRPAGCFVTLKVRGELNGCIGSIQTGEPLGSAVARHAWSAAFADPRLPPLRRADHEHLDVEISVLSALQPVAARSRADLLGSLRPGVDGLLIVAGSRSAVFLPAVWDQVASPDMFVSQLLLKAGLAPTPWRAELRAFAFTAQKFGRRATARTMR